MVCTLLTEINYLNKALELFNTALVTPCYFGAQKMSRIARQQTEEHPAVLFTFSTLVTSVILFQGLKAPVLDIITLVLGFLVICSGITLLQMSKIDPAELKGLDRRSTVLLQASDKRTEDEKGLDIEDPGMDGLRGLGGVLGSLHRVNTARKSMLSRAELEERSEYRRRRRDTLIGQARAELEMGAGGLRRHQLWDAPMPSDAADRISECRSLIFGDFELTCCAGMHSRNGRSATLPSQKDAPLPAIPTSPLLASSRMRANTIHFDEAQVAGHEHITELPSRSDSFPKVQPFAPPEDVDDYDHPPSIRPSIRLAPARSSTEHFGYSDPYGSEDRGLRSAPPLDRGLRSAPLFGSVKGSSPMGARQRTDSNLTAASASSNRSWSRHALSPRTRSFHLRRKDEQDEREKESLVGSPDPSGEADLGTGSESDTEVMGGRGADSGRSSGSESYNQAPVTPLDRTR